MTWEFQKDPADGSPLERSGSGLPSAGGEGETRTPASESHEGYPEETGVPDAQSEATDGEAIEDSPARSDEDSGIPESGTGFVPREALPRLSPKRRGRRLVKKPELVQGPLTPQQRLLILDTWNRSGLPARDFAALVGISRQTLYAWKYRFKKDGPAGLEDQPKGAPRGSRVSEVTRRAILMLKEAHPEFGCQRIADMLLRGPALPASPSAVAKVLLEAGYESEEVPTRPHGQKPKRFERAAPNDLWQTDLFTFMLKRQNRRVYLVAFMDDHSRFVVGYGLHATQSASLVLEVLRSAIINYRSPKEILTDNGSQYVTWRGRSAFTRELEQRGIRHIIASPRRPQTLGKVERFWGSLWRECVQRAIFLDIEDARRRIGLYMDYHNFQRPHQGIDGLTPADRYFGAAPDVLRTLKARVEANALDLARNGVPKAPFYLTGNAGGQSFSVHAEGERVILQKDGQRKEIELTRKDQTPEVPPEPLCPAGSFESEGGELDPEAPPGTSPLDDVIGLGEDPKEEDSQSESEEDDDDHHES